MVHDHSLPLGDRDDEDTGWSAKDIADDIYEWNLKCPLTSRIDIMNPVHPEMAPHQKQDVVYHLCRMDERLRSQLNEVVSIPSPQAIWANAELHGWHAPATTLNDDLVHIHCEVSEAFKASFSGKMEGMDSVGEELADIVIGAFHTARKHGIDIVSEIHRKHQYNTTRTSIHSKSKV